MSSIDFTIGSLSRTTSVPNSQLFSVCWWQRYTSATPADFSTSFSLDDGGVDDYVQISTTSNFTWFLYTADVGEQQLLATDTVWRFFSIVRNGTGAASSVVRYAIRGAAFTTYTANTQPATTITRIYFGSSGFGDVFAGQLRNMKVWNGVALTAAELTAEMYSSKPVRYNGLWYFNPLLTASGAPAQDQSGAGNTFTQAGTLTVSTQDPGIPWQSSRGMFL